ncbi:uncharacterized protein LY79DRAFT_221131 [Colletotrichum navitas]|uniref:Uncharacterized protein n=1 Tax=Colletotrichum navitas TaxID=681940 RepID=A0AAD8PYJ0_9PEZI|nr:uncharacterized protein LY79DRAFT_221131 [Colletotrichum navitas]KAK1590301.1 hypothetical protein LY79DRAFT_221131 [Colletotrichum navitas]
MCKRKLLVSQQSQSTDGPSWRALWLQWHDGHDGLRSHKWFFSGAATGKMHDGTRYPTKKPNNDMQRVCIIAARLVYGYASIFLAMLSPLQLGISSRGEKTHPGIWYQAETASDGPPKTLKSSHPRHAYYRYVNTTDTAGQLMGTVTSSVSISTAPLVGSVAASECHLRNTFMHVLTLRRSPLAKGSSIVFLSTRAYDQHICLLEWHMLFLSR